MAEAALRDYLNEIDRLVEHGSNDEAIQHCRHLLSQYPKCVAAYRLLGKALLEQEEDPAAQDVFERVLSVDPEDFVARVGLSIIHDRNSEFDLAIWHMERAFDIAPSNELIQGELRRLYARRDGFAPERIALTRSALARMYVKGDLYDEAIADLRKMLAEQPNRVDLQIQLAEALWRNEQRLDAIDWTQRVTKHLPHCVKANLINAAVLHDNGELTESEALFKRAQAVDPENLYAEELFGSDSPLPPADVTVSQLELRGTEELLEAAAPVAEVEEVPDWLRGVTDLDTLEPSLLEGAESYPALSAGMHMPEGEVSPAAEIPDWLQGLAESATPAAEEEVPNWLAALAGGGTAAGVAEPEAAEPEAPTAVPTDEDVPDWLSQLSANAGPIGTSGPLESTSEEEPASDWLSQIQETPTASFSPTEAEVAEPQAETPDWLDQLQGSQQVSVASELSDETAVPDWLRTLGASAESEQPSEESTVEAASPTVDTTWWTQSGEEQAEAQVEAGIVSTTEEESPQPSEVESYTLEAVSEVKEEASTPAPPEEMPSADDALAFLAKLAAGKEDQLRAEAQAEAETRMAEIMGRKAEAKGEPPAAPVKMTVPAATVAAVAAGLASKKEQEVAPEEVKHVEEQIEPVVLDTEVTPKPPEEMPSADDALAFLAKLAAGKEDQLRAEAQAEAETRMAEIMGRKTGAKSAEPKSAKSAIGAAVATEAIVTEQEKVTPAVPPSDMTPAETAPTPPEEMPSADDALAFLAKLAAGKEDQLRAEAQAEAETRMAEIMGRRAEAKPIGPTSEKPTPQAGSVTETVVREAPLKHDKSAQAKEPPADTLPPDSESTDWLDLLQPSAETAVVETTPENTLPEWLRAMRPSDETSDTSTEETFVPPTEGEVPDWLQAMRPTDEGETPLEGEAESTPANELPTWLQAMRPVEEEGTTSEVNPPEGSSVTFDLTAEAELSVAEQPALEWWVQVAEDEGEESYQAAADQLPGDFMLGWWVQSAEDEGEEPLAELPAFQEITPAVVSTTTAAGGSSGRKQTQPGKTKASPLAKSEAPSKKQTGPINLAEATGTIESLLSRLLANEDDHEARLELARTYWATGKREDAFEAYSRLADSNAYAREIVSDVEGITAIHDHPDWHRLLGDVCMKTGKLTQALEHYRRALSEL